MILSLKKTSNIRCTRYLTITFVSETNDSNYRFVIVSLIRKTHTASVRRCSYWELVQTSSSNLARLSLLRMWIGFVDELAPKFEEEKKAAESIDQPRTLLRFVRSSIVSLIGPSQTIGIRQGPREENSTYESDLHVLLRRKEVEELETPACVVKDRNYQASLQPRSSLVHCPFVICLAVN